MQINIEDYLSHDEIKNICQDVIRQHVKSWSKENLERIISNTGYSAAWRIIDDQFDINMQEQLKNKMLEVLNNLTAFSVFRYKDVWQKEESPATTYMNQVVHENLHIIKENVLKSMKQIPVKELGRFIKEAVIEKLSKSL